MRRATAALCLVGVAIASYLTWVHYAGLKPVCVGGGGGCERVQSSEYAALFGVPVAVLGVLGYLGVLGTLALPDGRTAAAFLSLVGVAFSAYLTWLELAEIHAVCQWCVASALVMTALAGVSIARLLRLEGWTTP